MVGPGLAMAWTKARHRMTATRAHRGGTTQWLRPHGWEVAMVLVGWLLSTRQHGMLTRMVAVVLGGAAPRCDGPA